MEGEICGKTPRHPSHGWLPAACVRNVLRAPSPAGSVSSPSQARPGALTHCNMASFPQETCSFPLDMHSPVLLGLSLLKVPCSERMDQGASTGRPCMAKGDGQGHPMYHIARNFFRSIEGVMQLNITPDFSISLGTLVQPRRNKSEEYDRL